MQLEKRVAFRRKRCAHGGRVRALPASVRPPGIKVRVLGRLNGAEIAAASEVVLARPAAAADAFAHDIDTLFRGAKPRPYGHNRHQGVALYKGERLVHQRGPVERGIRERRPAPAASEA